MAVSPRLLVLLSAFVLAVTACASTSGRPELGRDVEVADPPAAATDEPPEPDAAESDAAEPSDDGTDDDAGATGTDDDAGVPAEVEGAPVGSLADARIGVRAVAVVERPAAIATRPGSDSLFVAGLNGPVWELTPADDGSFTTDEPILDLSDRTRVGSEQGLLGIAISPDGEHLYAVHSIDDGSNRLVEFAFDGDEIDLGSEREVLVVEQPAGNHNGGHIAFGPDGFLYYGLGDGGGSGDPFATGQDPTSLLATILRIDPRADGDAPYGVPADNPFVDRTGRDEVWLFGVRNPWRFSFDAATGDLWIGDVGQNAIEEISVLPAAEGGGAGANLGWSRVEGTLPFSGDAPPDHTPPVYQYGHDEGCSITGGYVYRGTAVPDLTGAYVFADYCSSSLRALTVDADGQVVHRFLDVTLPSQSVLSFGEGPDGELYVLSAENVVYRITAA